MASLGHAGCFLGGPLLYYREYDGHLKMEMVIFRQLVGYLSLARVPGAPNNTRGAWPKEYPSIPSFKGPRYLPTVILFEEKKTKLSHVYGTVSIVIAHGIVCFVIWGIYSRG